MTTIPPNVTATLEGLNSWFFARTKAAYTPELAERIQGEIRDSFPGDLDEGSIEMFVSSYSRETVVVDSREFWTDNYSVAQLILTAMSNHETPADESGRAIAEAARESGERIVELVHRLHGESDLRPSTIEQLFVHTYESPGQLAGLVLSVADAIGYDFAKGEHACFDSGHGLPEAVVVELEGFDEAGASLMRGIQRVHTEYMPVVFHHVLGDLYPAA